MNRHRRTLTTLLPLTLCGLTAVSGAQGNVAGGIGEADLRLIVPAPPGGHYDAVGRLIARRLGDAGVGAVVNNLSGANGVIAANSLRSTTLPDSIALLASTSLFSVVPVLAPETLNFVPEQELVPIATVGLQKYLLVARSDFDVVALLNRQPATASAGPFARIAAVGSASVMYLYASALANALRKPLDIIPYRGMADVRQALLGGQVELALMDEWSAQPLHSGGRVQLVAAMSSEPCILFPDVALWRQLGFPALDMDLLFSIYTGSRMSQARRGQLAARLAVLGRTPAFHEELRRLGMKPLVLTGSDATRYVQDSVERDRRFLRTHGR